MNTTCQINYPVMRITIVFTTTIKHSKQTIRLHTISNHIQIFTPHLYNIQVPSDLMDSIEKHRTLQYNMSTRHVQKNCFHQDEYRTNYPYKAQLSFSPKNIARVRLSVIIFKKFNLKHCRLVESVGGLLMIVVQVS